MANYYIATAANGGNDGNTGLTGSPLLTLAHACTHATTAGDIINVGVGTFTETSVSNLAIGVNITGAGVTSVVKAGYASYALIMAVTETSGTNGNQTISNLKFDGNSLTGLVAVHIKGRSNVKVHDCTFVDFNTWGVSIQGQINTDTPDPSDNNITIPAIYATGNEFYNNTITNCSLYYNTQYGYGALIISGQEGMLVHDNNISQSGRGSGQDGFCISSMFGGCLRGVKIYNNTITRPNTNGAYYDFSMEFYNVFGMEMYNNTILGSVDVNMYDKADYAFGVDFHHNTCGPTSQLATHMSGFEFELGSSDVIVRNNYFRNLNYAIYGTLDARGTALFDNINIYNNIFDGIGTTGDTEPGTAMQIGSGVGNTASNINIWNNTIYGRYAQAEWGIILPAGGTANNISIKNNIIMGFSASPIYCDYNAAGTIDVLAISNNNLYSNGNSNNPDFQSITPTNYTNSGNITTDPLFVDASIGNFHLQSNSPCINAGINVGLTTDYTGNIIVELPDIGAYEYIVVSLKYLIANSKLIIAGGKYLTIPTPPIYDFDGNVYRSVIIGTQEWLVQNLNTTHYNDGTLITYEPDASAWLNGWMVDTIGRCCWYDNNSVVNANSGLLYNWHAVNTGKLAPTGWRVPSTTDWDTLMAELGGTDLAGGKLKEVGLAHWTSPNEGATNSSGFTLQGVGWRNMIALPPDYIVAEMIFEQKLEKTVLWSSTNNGTDYAYFYIVTNYASNLTQGFDQKVVGCSVRCMRG
jgi:uncharacterized protein (TIGR02145 family)